MHIYGLAADISPIVDYDGNGVANESKDWDDLCGKAVAEGACIEPYFKASNRVHMDWRQAGCDDTWPHGKEDAEEAKKMCKDSHTKPVK